MSWKCMSKDLSWLKILWSQCENWQFEAGEVIKGGNRVHHGPPPIWIDFVSLQMKCTYGWDVLHEHELSRRVGLLDKWPLQGNHSKHRKWKVGKFPAGLIVFLKEKFPGGGGLFYLGKKNRKFHKHVLQTKESLSLLWLYCVKGLHSQHEFPAIRHANALKLCVGSRAGKWARGLMWCLLTERWWKLEVGTRRCNPGWENPRNDLTSAEWWELCSKIWVHARTHI